MLQFGAFRFLDPGDLSGNTLAELVCPRNLAGQVSAYLIAHHGDYDSNLPAVYEALRPRVAIMKQRCGQRRFTRRVQDPLRNSRPDRSLAVARVSKCGSTERARRLHCQHRRSRRRLLGQAERERRWQLSDHQWPDRLYQGIRSEALTHHLARQPAKFFTPLSQPHPFRPVQSRRASTPAAHPAGS